MPATTKMQAAAIRLQKFSYRFAEQVLNSKLALKDEIEGILLSSGPLSTLSRPNFNKLLDQRFKQLGWQPQPAVFDDPGDPGAKMDFLKERIGIEVGFGHASFIGIDLLKFQVSSYSALDKIECWRICSYYSALSKDSKEGVSPELGRITHIRKSLKIPSSF